MKRYYLAVDIGASSGRHILGNVEDGRIVLEEIYRFQNGRQNMTECAIVFGDGVGVLPWMVCGGREIAVATAEKIKTYNVMIWAQHGIFCAGNDFDEIFGLAHTVEKSAEIFVKVASMTGGLKKEQVITNENLKDLCSLADSFGVTISKTFLE